MSAAINHVETQALIDEDAREIALRTLRQQNFRRVVALAREHAPPSARTLLDVGSAHGWFLDAAAEHFEVHGVEPDEAVARRCAARGHQPRVGFFPQVLAPGERFDVIVFNDVIEHIPDIRAALRDCHERLPAGGILVLNLPSSRGLFYRLSKLMARLGLRGLFDRLWQVGLPSPHVHYFAPDNLAQLVQSEGFDLRHSDELAVATSEGLWQRLNMVGKVNPLKAALQYVVVRAVVMPLARLFPSDIMVCIFARR
ncbi:class I SAM-dependent methyltransferase [Massilia sp. SR12]